LPIYFKRSDLFALEVLMTASDRLPSASWVESHLILAILDGRYAPGDRLPPERRLAGVLGVTRPTLREALQRLARDGWIDIHHGRPTRVRDYRRQGSLGVLGSIARLGRAGLPATFIPDLLIVRLWLAPRYARLAVERQPGTVLACLAAAPDKHQSADQFSRFDFELHLQLTQACGNSVLPLIMNGFHDLYQAAGPAYFSHLLARRTSLDFYRGLHAAARLGDSAQAETITKLAMERSLELWSEIAHQAGFE
jgi:GntR family transcriptional regulator, negative regulator for fad regulon and positive regulator of fabA